VVLSTLILTIWINGGGRFVSRFLTASSLIEPATNGKNVDVVFSFSKILRLHTSRGFAVVIYAAKFTNVSHRAHRGSAPLVARLSICTSGRPLPCEIARFV